MSITKYRLSFVVELSEDTLIYIKETYQEVKDYILDDLDYFLSMNPEDYEIEEIVEEDPNQEVLPLHEKSLG